MDPTVLPSPQHLIIPDSPGLGCIHVLYLMSIASSIVVLKDLPLLALSRIAGGPAVTHALVRQHLISPGWPAGLCFILVCDTHQWRAARLLL